MTNHSILSKTLNRTSERVAQPGGAASTPTKTYQARSMDDAIKQAREELGSEAMLLNTRKLATDQGLPGGYEVVFGLPDEAPREPKSSPFSPPPQPDRKSVVQGK